jgi:NAD(P)-dependent dehydrogenase (short-subunit alcohol dehydrogenase family)
VSNRQLVAVVTGGGGGIGAAIAEELGRTGWHVVTVDPLVTLDGSAQLEAVEATTADRIVAAGGSAQASSTSVTDGEAVARLFRELVDQRGGLDAVVNVAGITRQTYFGKGTEEDWLAVLDVHLNGYFNVLNAALPLMAAAGSGHILGVTSGSGWRAADAGAYSCAKRAVAAMTWQLGAKTPPGVTVNAMSPIAATRMMASALERARKAGRSGGGGISFLSVPGPEALGPFGAYLAGEEFGWCSGQVLFAGGSEAAVVDQPRLIEAVRTDHVDSLARVLDAVVPGALVKAEASQKSEGGSNARFGAIFEAAAETDESVEETDPNAQQAPPRVRSCAVVSDRSGIARSLTTMLEGHSITCHPVEVTRGFGDVAKALAATAESAGSIDAVVVALAGVPAASSGAGTWEAMLSEHRSIVEDLHNDASWARAAADYAAAADRPVQLVTLTDATTSAGKSRAQAAAQHARVAVSATEGRVTAFAVGIEASEEETAEPVSELVAHLLTHPEAETLNGAELAVGAGWIGLRSHPRPTGSITFGGPGVPVWLDGVLREMVGNSGRPSGRTT